MEKRCLRRASLREAGPTSTLGISNVQITPILMGTWQAGKRMWVGIEHADSISLLAQRLLTGKFALGHKFDPTDNRAKNKLFQGENFERAQQALGKLRPIVHLHNCTLAQLSLAWLIAQSQTNA